MAAGRFSTTRLLACSCMHEFQDAAYGVRMRVHNRRGSATTSKNAGSSSGWRCTVCTKEKHD